MKINRINNLLISSIILFALGCGKDDEDNKLVPLCTNSSFLNMYNENNSYILPNAFTPDGDGRNDGLKLLTTDTNITDFNMTIYDDATNELVFEANNYDSKWFAPNTNGYKYSVLISFKGNNDYLIDTCCSIYRIETIPGKWCIPVNEDSSKYVFPDQVDIYTGSLYSTTQVFCD